ncbi:hypothetical protein IIB79_11310, partial [candidate division KSB1 bacterium]|nr:hypothetical protein [candidate division KSB1 bacterium]
MNHERQYIYNLAADPDIDYFGAEELVEIEKLGDIEKQINPVEKKSTGVQLPTDHLEWIKVARPYVGKIKRTFEWEPFWLDVYKNKSPNIVVVNGRQSFKSTFGTDIIGCYATSHDNSEVTYIVDREDRVSAWSKQRFRKDT